MAEPTITVEGDLSGAHNREIRRARDRVKAGKAYRNASIVVVIPVLGAVDSVVVERWLALQPLMNQPMVRIFVRGMEVGAAYQAAVETIKTHPELRTFRYMLTMEHDNTPPVDGIARLVEAICAHDAPCNDEPSIVAGLYWTKGPAGQPMIYGTPDGILDFAPQPPRPIDGLQFCNGTGMGFTLYHLGLFDKVEPPWFVTPQGPNGVGTQDLFFAAKVRGAGYRIASHNGVRVGHLDTGTGQIW